MVGALPQRNVPHVADNDVLGQLGATVQHDVLPGPPIELFDGPQELDGIADVRYPFDRFHVERFVARSEALVDLLQPEETCGGKEMGEERSEIRLLGN